MIPASLSLTTFTEPPVGSGLRPCRRASARRGAGPNPRLRRLHQSGLNGVPLDISSNPQELRVAADDMIVTLLLPKRSPDQTKNPTSFMARKSFQGSKPFACRNTGRNQHVNVIGHNHETVETISVKPNVSIQNSRHDHPGDFRLPKVDRSGSRVIEQLVHRDERSTPTDSLRRESPVNRQCATQPESHEHPLPHRIPMRQPSLISIHRLHSGTDPRYFSPKSAPGGSPAAGPKPCPYNGPESC